MSRDPAFQRGTVARASTHMRQVPQKKWDTMVYARTHCAVLCWQNARVLSTNSVYA